MASQANAPSGLLVHFEEFDAFREAKGFPPGSVLPILVEKVKSLDEREELEPLLRSILFDSNSTPHGPSEIVDILTHKVSMKGASGLAGFILKGRSFPTVRPKHVSHQIYRLEKIVGLKFCLLAASGNVLDSAKEQFCSTAERLGCRYAILDAHDLARLFIAYGLLCPRDGQRIAAGKCACGYCPQRRLLNVLQVEALDALSLARRLGQQSGLIVLPTGSGKTRIAAEDAQRRGAKCILYIGHTQEMLDVACSEFEAVFSKKSVARHSVPKTISTLTTVNLITIQLLRRNLRRLNAGAFDYIVIDEFHHAAAKSYRTAVSHLDPKFLLGLTATPYRGDQQDISQLCGGNVLIDYDLRKGVETGILAPYHYYGCFDDVDYSSLAHNGIRYDIRDLERALIIPERDEAIIRTWKKQAEDRPTLAFCCSQKHAHRVVASFKAAGVPAQVYLSDTPVPSRTTLIQQLQKGELKVLCAVDVLNEGADLPFLECLLFLRPTESQRVFYQQLGRGLRRFIGKTHCIVIDFIGAFKNAYKIVGYQGLLPLEQEEAIHPFSSSRSFKEIFNLPLGCEVHFDEKVIDIFTKQVFDAKNATRHNISRILIYEYVSLMKYLKRKPSAKDVDRCQLLDSSFYRLVFGSWDAFESVVRDIEPSIGVQASLDEAWK